MARGLRAVGGSAPFLLSAFLGVLVLWLIYSSTGVVQIAKPGILAQIEAVPPIQSALDADFFYVGMRAFTLASNVAIALGLLALRAALIGFWVSLAIERFEPGATGWEAAGAAARRTRDSFRTMVGMQAALMVILVGLSILAPFLGQLLLPLLFIGPLYFLAFAPVAAVRERTGIRRAFGLSLAATRLRGSQHSILVFGYGFLTLMLLLSTSGGVATPVTPSILVWAYVLFVNFVHVGMLATFTYRWLLIRDAVIASGAGEPRHRGRPASSKPSLAGLR